MVRFMFWMLLASGLGFVKLTALVFLMDADDYGIYISLLGIAILFGIVISFGILERPIKLYPRLFSEGKRQAILDDARRILTMLLVRFCILGAVASSVVIFSEFRITFIEVLSVVVLGFLSGTLTLLASIYRAYGSKSALQAFSLWRSGCTCVLALVLGFWLGWSGAIFGDILGSVIAISYTAVKIIKLYSFAPDVEAEQSEVKSDAHKGSSGHQSLYIANMVTASASMADKSIVAAALGAATAGSYGVIMLLPQISQMLVNVVSQYIGPLVIKFVHTKHKDETRISALGLQAFLLAGLAVVLVVSALVAKQLPILQFVFTKYNISDLSLILAGVIASAQIYSLIEFHLIAHDSERYVLLASILAGTAFFLLFGTAFYYSMPLEYFIAAAAIARCVQVFMLAWFYRSLVVVR